MYEVPVEHTHPYSDIPIPYTVVCLLLTAEQLGPIIQ